MQRIAIIGGGISGLTAAYEAALAARRGVAVEAMLFEASSRFGGTVETVREGGFVLEGGPDAWVTAKPWARHLAIELGLAGELLPSNDAARRTWILQNGALAAMPDGMNMMVPTDLAELDASLMFSASAKAAYRAESSRAAELLAGIPKHDESVAEFVRRHFGDGVLNRVAAPLLSGIFGGDVNRLSVRAVMPKFVALERTHGSLVTALAASPSARSASQPAVFTTLRTGLGTLVDRLVAVAPPHWLRLRTPVRAIQPHLPGYGFRLLCGDGTDPTTNFGDFDAVLLATPVDVTARLLEPLLPGASRLLPGESSSAVLVSFGFADTSRIALPEGFGFLVPPGATIDGTPSRLLACTFADQKFPGRVPPGGRLLRVFFGGAAAERLLQCGNDELAAIARMELSRILRGSGIAGQQPILTIVRRWPRSLPQYTVGHLDRIAELEARRASQPSLSGLRILGNGLHGVGLPDLIRDARATVQNMIG